MTVIIASASKMGCVVSSDGLVSFGSKRMEKNKTVRLYNGKIIVAFAGMMSFGTNSALGFKETEDWIKMIEEEINPKTLKGFAHYLSKRLNDIVSQLNSGEWAIANRNLVVFVAGAKKLQKRDYMIYEVNIHPDPGKTYVMPTITPHGPDKTIMLKLVNSGDGAVQNAALFHLETFKNQPSLSRFRMFKEHKIALQKGIDAGIKSNPNPLNVSCGGNLYFRYK